MYKILIADDEIRVLKFLQTSIPWTELGLELSASASDGAEALRLAIALKPDIVITDIRMPEVNGLDFCRKLHDINPNIQVIIISAFADFEYAKQAIQLHTLGYCLKPIDPNEMITYLRSAIRNLKQETGLNGDDLLDSIEENDDERTSEILQYLGLNSDTVHIAVSVGTKNISALLEADLAFKIGKHKYLYLSAEPFQEEAAYEMICYAPEKCGVGIFPDPVPCSQLNSAVSTTELMAHQFFINDCPTFCKSLVTSPLIESLHSQLTEALSSAANLKQFIDRLLTANLSMIFNLKSAYKLYHEIRSSDYFSAQEEDYYTMNHYEYFALKFNCFADALTSLSESIDTLPLAQNAPKASSSSSFMKIIRYLNENYEKDITLKSLSDIFYLNSSYISQLIKNETGITYSQYLTELRIKKAKQLLKTTDMSLNQISEAVGFNDYFYFIKQFKKIVGVTPGKYNVMS